jgi:Zn-dependent peptidase ImmA (M78 family)/DNA-binding XRE family transcriptional regulator
MEQKFNPSILELARESRRQTQAALSAAVGAAQGTISKLENGQGTPSDELLEKIARALGYESSIFFEPFEPRGPGLFLHRKKSALSIGEQKAIHATIEIVRMQVQKLLRSVEIPEMRIPFVDVDRVGRRPAEIAKELRMHWGLPKGPIENMTSVLESIGVIVILFDFNSRLIDGMSVYSTREPIPPIIFLNSKSPGERTRFTAAHELGHLVLHYHQDFPAETAEDEADAFAGEFLLPSSDIRGFLGGLTLESLGSLKQRWRVSMQALLTAAERLGRITPYKAKGLWMEMSRLGYRTREPLEIPVEEPTVIRDIVKTHTSQLGYSDADVAKVVHLPVDTFQEVFKREAPKLRLLPTG